MNNFEFIEEYLTNRLGEQEKAAFEQQLVSDPALKADLDLQKQIIEGVRKARGIELKAMLNQVPVSGSSSGFSGGKIAAAAITVGVITVALYLYFQPGEQKNSTAITLEHPIQKQEVLKAQDSTLMAVPTPAVTTTAVPERKEEKSKPIAEKRKETEKKSGPAQPKIEVVDPSAELAENTDRKTGPAEGQKSAATVSHIAVETNASNDKYNFHYQFSNGKLMLYGSFDKGLYEILEINGEHKTVFLFYKGSYYLLNEKENNITPLEPIKEGPLLRKLKEYRGQ